MKRALSLLLAASLSLSLVACGKTSDPGGSGSGSGSGSKAPTELSETQKIIQEAQGMTLEELAKKHYHAISARLSISQEEVRSAERLIRELNPRPGSIFALPSEISYIQPDILIEEIDGHFTARLRNSDRPYFQINSYYRSLLTQSDDAQVREYLTLKLRQAENVLWAIGQRETTLLRCAQAIAGRQQDFFRSGPSALRPLRLSDIAQELEIHESTVSRAIRDKYVQCPRGGFPLRHFLSRRAAGESGAEVGSCAAKELLRRLIREEDSTKPLSDQKLCTLLTEQGCPISRRTVAKYREELNIPSASGRKRP